MKRLLIIAFALALVGCGKQAQAETTPTTEATIADQASKEVEELTKLEEEGKIEYDEVSGDIVSTPEQEKQNEDMMNVIRQEVIDGDIKGLEIDEEVDMWCDFLSDTEKAEFKSELHLLDSPEPEVIPEQQTKPAPKETKPAPQPTQPVQKPKETQPQVTEPASQPTQPVQQPTIEPGSTVKDANGNEVHRGKLDTNQTLSDEQIDAINNSQWN